MASAAVVLSTHVRIAMTIEAVDQGQQHHAAQTQSSPPAPDPHCARTRRDTHLQPEACCWHQNESASPYSKLIGVVVCGLLACLPAPPPSSSTRSFWGTIKEMDCRSGCAKSCAKTVNQKGWGWALKITAPKSQSPEGLSISFVSARGMVFLLQI